MTDYYFQMRNARRVAIIKMIPAKELRYQLDMSGATGPWNEKITGFGVNRLRLFAFQNWDLIEERVFDWLRQAKADE